MDINAIRTRYEAGETKQAARAIYDAMLDWQRPGWAADVLELACTRLTAVPGPVQAVVEIGRSRRRLSTAHAAFSAVRDLTLAADRAGSRGEYGAVLSIAEDAAKVMYNASGVREPVGSDEDPPFDDECGYHLVGGMAYLARISGSAEFGQSAWAVHEHWLGGRRRATGPRGSRPWWRFWDRRPGAAEPPPSPRRGGPSFS